MRVQWAVTAHRDVVSFGDDGNVIKIECVDGYVTVNTLEKH